jgi:hypothetical protein
MALACYSPRPPSATRPVVRGTESRSARAQTFQIYQTSEKAVKRDYRVEQPTISLGSAGLPPTARPREALAHLQNLFFLALPLGLQFLDKLVSQFLNLIQGVLLIILGDLLVLHKFLQGLIRLSADVAD